MKDDRTVSRPEDMSPDGRLELHQQDDGDIIVQVRAGEGDGGAMASVEFCNSGGHSPWTLMALRELMKAMRKDEARHPWPADYQQLPTLVATPRGYGLCLEVEGDIPLPAACIAYIENATRREFMRKKATASNASAAGAYANGRLRGLWEAEVLWWSATHGKWKYSG